VFECQAEERAVLLHQMVIVDPATRHGEDDVVILNRLRIQHRLKGVVVAVAVERVSHGSSDPKETVERPKIEDGGSKIAIFHPLSSILDFFARLTSGTFVIWLIMHRDSSEPQISFASVDGISFFL
jgi:hypothetical protein